jgi:hypothetical protein
MKKIIAIYAIVLCLNIPAHAEIEKNALTCDTGICFYWWPKLPDVKGWHQDKDASYGYQVNALAPDGLSFRDAESVMYAKALYKPRTPETKSLDMLIADDQKEFLASDPGIKITETASLITGSHKKLRCFTFFPSATGNWELVCYGEEGEFYLVFTLSSKSKIGFGKTLDTYKSLVSSYKE